MSSSLSLKEKILLAAKTRLDRVYQEFLVALELTLLQGPVQSTLPCRMYSSLEAEYVVKQLEANGISATVTDLSTVTIDVSFVVNQLQADIRSSVASPQPSDLTGWIRIDCLHSPFGSNNDLYRQWIEATLVKQNLSLLPPEGGNTIGSFMIPNTTNPSEPLIHLEYKVYDAGFNRVSFVCKDLDAQTHRQVDACLRYNGFILNRFKPETSRIKLHFFVQ